MMYHPFSSLPPGHIVYDLQLTATALRLLASELRARGLPVPFTQHAKAFSSAYEHAPYSASIRPTLYTIRLPRPYRLNLNALCVPVSASFSSICAFSTRSPWFVLPERVFVVGGLSMCQL